MVNDNIMTHIRKFKEILATNKKQQAANKQTKISISIPTKLRNTNTRGMAMSAPPELMPTPIAAPIKPRF